MIESHINLRAMYEHMEGTLHDFLICTKVDNIDKVLYQPRGTKNIIKKSLNKYVIEGDDGKYISISDITKMQGFYIYLCEASIDELNEKLCIKIDIEPPINVTTNIQCGSLIIMKKKDAIILYQTVFIGMDRFKMIDSIFSCEIDDDTIDMINMSDTIDPVSVRIYPTSKHYSNNDIIRFRMLLSGKDYFMDKRNQQPEKSIECVSVVIKCIKLLRNAYIKDNEENIKKIKNMLEDVHIDLQQRIKKCTKLDESVSSMCNILEGMECDIHHIFPPMTRQIKLLDDNIERTVNQLDEYLSMNV